ncbi:MAG: hypothetical protein ACFFDW_02220 [Candidatus Thorarchaeota archaeon]
MKEKIIMTKIFGRDLTKIYSFLLPILIVVNLSILHINPILGFEGGHTTLFVQEKTVIESYVDCEYTQFETGIYTKDSIVHINITILPQSNDSVEVFYFGSADQFSPSLSNITLAPGESFAENYTIIESEGDMILYYCQCVNPEGNATVLWWYEVLYSATPQGFIGSNAIALIGTFTLSVISLYIVGKKKARK